MFRYAHTNMIARDHKKLIAFYKEVYTAGALGRREICGGSGWIG